MVYGHIAQGSGLFNLTLSTLVWAHAGVFIFEEANEY